MEIILHTPHLTLRAPRATDHRALHINFFSDEKSASTMLWKPCKKLSDSEEMMRDLIALGIGGHAFVIVLNQTNQPIGRIHIKPVPNSFDFSIGFGIGSAFTGKGYGTEALGAVLDYWLNTLNHTEIHSSYIPNNVASEKLLFKMGFVPSGTHTVTRKHTGEEILVNAVTLYRQNFTYKK